MFRTKGANWVADTKATHCAHGGCGKAFSMRIRRHHCRACGLIFCDEHSLRRMRLDGEGAPSESMGVEPVRVCDGCFEKFQAPPQEREAPTPKTGTALRLHIAGEVSGRNLTEDFRAVRAVHNAERRRASEPMLAAYSRLREVESKASLPMASKRVVEWQKDNSVAACSVCHRGFTPLLRKHHCRLCGSVVCNDCSAHRKGNKLEKKGAEREAAGAASADAEERTFTYRACSSCHELVARSSRAEDFARRRLAAESSNMTSVYEGISAAARGVRREMALYEEQVTAFGTPGARASVADITGTQQRLEQWLATLMAELKRFAAIPASGAEVTIKDAVKRAPAALLKEGLPKFHSLKRTLLDKVEKKKAAPNAPNAAGSAFAGGAGTGTAGGDGAAAGGGAVGFGAAAEHAAAGQTAAPPGVLVPVSSAAGGGGGAEATSSSASTPTNSAAASPHTNHADGPTGEGSSSSSAGAMPSQPFAEKVMLWRQSVRDKVGSVAASLPPLPEVSNPFGGAAAAGSFAAPNPFGAGGSTRSTEDADTDAAPHNGSRRASSDAPVEVSDYATYDAGCSAGVPPLSGGGLAGAGAGGVDTILGSLFATSRAPSPPPADVGPIPLDEYLLAKRCLIELSRASMLFAKTDLELDPAVQALKDEHLQRALLELNAELDMHCDALDLDPAEQLREFTAAITATKQGDTSCDTRDELISRLLGVATQSYNRLVEDVSAHHFVAAREALLYLRDGLKEFYMDNCIPY